MKQTPTASIVVPAYNCAETVTETLRSLSRQTFTDLEIIVVDDGSTDATARRAQDCGDPRVRLVQQRNRGLAGAHNTGIAAARGEYVGFCDADDLWLPEKLELHVAHLRARPEVGVSFAGSRMIDGLGRRIGLSQRPRLGRIDAAHVFKRNPIGNGSTAVFRREALDALRYRPLSETERDWWFDETFRQSDDIEAWTRFALTADWRMEAIPGLLTLYRIHDAGLSANVERQFESWERMCSKMALIAPAFVKKHGGAAAAYQLRYLARRAVSMRAGALARRLCRRALRLSFAPIYEEPIKTFLTLCAAEVLAAAGSRAYSAIEKAALGARST